jgi:hypothetical protein
MLVVLNAQIAAASTPDWPEHLPDTLGDEAPIGLRVKHLGAGHARKSGMRPFPLRHAHLIAVD